MDSQLEHEKHVRQRVNSILNFPRENFCSSPDYNDFLEKREEVIFHLCYEKNETKKKNIQDELMLYEANNQKLILDSFQKCARLNFEETKRIVAKEGIFFEIVKQMKFWTEENVSSKTFIHVLQKQYPKYFEDNQVNNQGQTNLVLLNIPKPLQNGILYSKIARKTNRNKKKIFLASGLSKSLIGYKLTLELWKGLLFPN